MNSSSLERDLVSTKPEALQIEANPSRVYYGRQLEVHFERRFFHWITRRAVGELVAEGRLREVEEPLVGTTRLKFVFRPGLRYYRRAIARSAGVVRRYSAHEVASACGEQADMLFLNALAARQFVCVGQDVVEYHGKRWPESGHDLDFVVERDGRAYGTEVKNALDYIDREELRTKIGMCQFFGITPLFIVRAMPKSYVNDYILPARGFALVFGTLMYPFGFTELVREMRDVLGLPVDCPRAVPAGVVERFLRWHGQQVER